MATTARDIIVIGFSAGGLGPLTAIVRALPGDLAAALFVVHHFPPGATSELPRILSRAGVLKAETAREEEPIRHGRIYLAPSDRHLLVRRDHVSLGDGPRENGHRPAIDPLFRSAAKAYGPRAVGLLLSGSLDDGTAGLAVLKRHGGVAIVQEPGEVAYPGMIRSALRHLPVDHVVPAIQIPGLLVRLACGTLPLSSEPVADHREWHDASS